MIVYKGFEREDVNSDLSINGTRGFLLAVSPVALVGLVVCIQDRCIKWEAAAGVGLTAFRDEHGVCVGGYCTEMPGDCWVDMFGGCGC